MTPTSAKLDFPSNLVSLAHWLADGKSILRKVIVVVVVVAVAVAVVG